MIAVPLRSDRPLYIRTLLRLCFMAGLGSGTLAQAAGALDSLLANSPFGSPPKTETAPATTSLELRSVLVDGSFYVFSVYEPSTKKSRWVRLGEGGGTIVARDYNAAKGTLRVDYNGHPLTLAFNTEQIDLSDLASDSGSRSPFSQKQPTVVARIQNTVPPLSASEANRLEQVAEVIRARRQARQSSTSDKTLPSSNKS